MRVKGWGMFLCVGLSIRIYVNRYITQSMCVWKIFRSELLNDTGYFVRSLIAITIAAVEVVAVVVVAIVIILYKSYS